MLPVTSNTNNLSDTHNGSAANNSINITDSSKFASTGDDKEVPVSVSLAPPVSADTAHETDTASNPTTPPDIHLQTANVYVNEEGQAYTDAPLEGTVMPKSTVIDVTAKEPIRNTSYSTKPNPKPTENKKPVRKFMRFFNL